MMKASKRNRMHTAGHELLCEQLFSFRWDLITGGLVGLRTGVIPELLRSWVAVFTRADQYVSHMQKTTLVAHRQSARKKGIISAALDTKVRVRIDEAYLSVEELLYTRQALLTVNTNPRVLSVVVLHKSEDDRGHIEIMEKRVDDLHLLARAPYDI